MPKAYHPSWWGYGREVWIEGVNAMDGVYMDVRSGGIMPSGWGKGGTVELCCEVLEVCAMCTSATL